MFWLKILGLVATNTAGKCPDVSLKILGGLTVVCCLLAVRSPPSPPPPIEKESSQTSNLNQVTLYYRNVDFICMKSTY